jgi:tRNA(fMet)-specific endonuclease VapC
LPPIGRVLLDTNIIIALFAGDPAVVSAIASAEAVFLPAVALGELYYGARKSARAADNTARISALAARAAIVPSDAGTAESYGRVKSELGERGTPIPESDIWIAALARQHGLTLASRDSDSASARMAAPPSS